jgi:hypothetical protein
MLPAPSAATQGLGGQMWAVPVADARQENLASVGADHHRGRRVGPPWKDTENF